MKWGNSITAPLPEITFKSLTLVPDPNSPKIKNTLASWATSILFCYGLEKRPLDLEQNLGAVSDKQIQNSMIAPAVWNHTVYCYHWSEKLAGWKHSSINNFWISQKSDLWQFFSSFNIKSLNQL